MPASASSQITEFMYQHPGQIWCAECVATAVQLTRSRVASLFLPMEGLDFFYRIDAVCKGCSRRRLGMQYDRRKARPFAREIVSVDRRAG